MRRGRRRLRGLSLAPLLLLAALLGPEVAAAAEAGPSSSEEGSAEQEGVSVLDLNQLGGARLTDARSTSSNPF